MTETPWATDSVKVSLAVLGKIKIDDHIDRLDVNSSGEQVWTYV